MKMNQTIHCSTFEEFGQMIFELVSRGLTFDADATNLIIQLTGGF